MTSLIISDNTTKIITNFNPSIEFNKHKKYEMCLLQLETYNSLPNIIEGENNKFIYSHDKGTTWNEIKLGTGAYDISNINDFLMENIIDNNIQSERPISIEANPNTLRSVLKITNENYQVDFTNNNTFRKLLGFEQKIYKQGKHESEQIVNILPVNSIFVMNNIIEGCTINGISTPIIFKFFPNVQPGEKIVIIPPKPIYLPIIMETITSMITTLTDQNLKQINLRNEEITIWYHIREQK